MQRAEAKSCVKNPCVKKLRQKKTKQTALTKKRYKKSPFFFRLIIRCKYPVNHSHKVQRLLA